jgi:hypothetical protein
MNVVRKDERSGGAVLSLSLCLLLLVVLRLFLHLENDPIQLWFAKAGGQHASVTSSAIVTEYLSVSSILTVNCLLFNPTWRV